MAIPHAQPGQPIRLLPSGDASGTEHTTALFKTPDLEVIRLVLRSGQSFPPHRVAGSITVQCLDGSIDFTVEDRHVTLQVGELLYLAGGALHGLTGIEDATALVTIALHA